MGHSSALLCADQVVVAVAAARRDLLELCMPARGAGEPLYDDPLDVCDEDVLRRVEAPRGEQVGLELFESTCRFPRRRRR